MMEIDGLLIVDKPEGMTSMGVVREIKRRFGIKKAGHIGTLDPFATGVLPVVINEGTKVVPFLEEEPKEYEATLKLGEETTTDDCTGEVISRNPWEEIFPETIHGVIYSFLGKIQQTPPMFSAIKVQGKPLYRLARKGIEIDRKEREVTIFDLRITMIHLPQVVFRVSCSKGTYIRTLARDIGKKIGCGGHLLHLRRVRSGPFALDRSISWETLKDLSDIQDLGAWLVTLKEALKKLPEVIGDERLVRKVRVGQEMVVRDLSSQELPAFEKGQCVRMTSSQGGLVAILKSEIRDTDLETMDPGAVALRPLRVFRTQNRCQNESLRVKEAFHGTRSGEEKGDYSTIQNARNGYGFTRGSDCSS
jgi:tRNA pseudouridine55 synthase